MTDDQFPWDQWLANEFKGQPGLLVPYLKWIEWARKGTLTAEGVALGFLRMQHETDLKHNGRTVDTIAAITLAFALNTEAERETQAVFEEELASLIESARNGNERSLRKCGLLMTRLIQLDFPIPFELGQLCGSILSGEVKRKHRVGRPKPVLRDEAIFLTVRLLLKCFPNLRATRNDATESESACSIIAQALPAIGVALSEKSVNGIYSRWI